MRARLERAGWHATERWDFDLYWRRQVPSIPFFEQLPAGARINHIPGIAALGSPARRPRHVVPVPGAFAATERLVLIASVDPLRLFVHEPDDSAPAGPVRDALDALVVAAVAGAYDALARGVRDHLSERTAPFELLRFAVAPEGSGAASLAACTLAPDVDEEVAAEVLALLGLAPLAQPPQPAQLGHGERGAPARFRRLVPGPRSRAFLEACPWPRWSDVLANDARVVDAPIAHVAASRVTGGSVVIFDAPSARFEVLNDTAGYVWERMRDGATPTAVAAAIAEQFDLDPDRAHGDVWDALARWASAGWIRRRDPGGGAQVQRDAPGRCLLAACGAIVAREGSDAVALVGRAASGIAGVAAMLSLRHPFRVVSDVPWVDEATGRAIPSAARLAVHESDDADVAAASPAFAAGPRHVAVDETFFRSHEPEPWRGEAPVVGPVVVVRRAARGAPTTLRPVPTRDLLLDLVALGLRAEPSWSTRRAAELLAWLEETPGYVLEAEDVASGAAALARGLAEPTASGSPSGLGEALGGPASVAGPGAGGPARGA